VIADFDRTHRLTPAERSFHITLRTTNHSETMLEA
jgi:hypothetical protein